MYIGLYQKKSKQGGGSEDIPFWKNLDFLHITFGNSRQSKAAPLKLNFNYILLIAPGNSMSSTPPVWIVHVQVHQKITKNTLDHILDHIQNGQIQKK